MQKSYICIPQLHIEPNIYEIAANLFEKKNLVQNFLGANMGGWVITNLNQVFKQKHICKAFQYIKNTSVSLGSFFFKDPQSELQFPHP